MTVSEASVDLRVGGEYVIAMRAPDGAERRVRGTYRVVEPPSRLVYTWRWDTSTREEPTLVTVEFHERGDTTEIVLRHEGFASAEEEQQHEIGWNGCLDKLETTVGSTSTH